MLVNEGIDCIMRKTEMSGLSYFAIQIQS